METALSWVGVALSVLGVLSSVVAVIVHCVLWSQAAKALKADALAEFAIPAAKFKRWVRVNSGMAVLVGVNAIRWILVSDVPRLRGVVPQISGFDVVVGAACDLLLVVMPIILICNMRAILRGKESDRG